VLIKTQDKWDAAYALLNMLLKDPERYCNMCGTKYSITKPYCCEQPQIGSNFDHLSAVVKQNKTRISYNKNSLGMGREKKMRSCLAMPPVLFNEWCNAFKELYGVKLFDKPEDMHACMRRLPFLRTCERV